VGLKGEVTSGYFTWQQRAVRITALQLESLEPGRAGKMDKAQRIETMRGLLPRDSKAQTVRGIARALRGGGRARYALTGYARVESRDAYHQARPPFSESIQGRRAGGAEGQA
jgi:hypothetical protein